ncbi:MAG TPA: hypothetical protein VL633_05960 [Bacteroidota bacterium]|nr:hypothetical protein [Bacteroidota bacterium]
MPSSKAPLPVTLLAWLFILVGVVGIGYHSTELNLHDPFADGHLVLGLLVRLLAIIGGVLLLRKVFWARWILILWTLYHVVLSATHSVPQLVLHCVVMIVVTYILLRPASAAYFKELTSQQQNEHTL